MTEKYFFWAQWLQSHVSGLASWKRERGWVSTCQTSKNMYLLLSCISHVYDMVALQRKVCSQIKVLYLWKNNDVYVNTSSQVCCYIQIKPQKLSRKLSSTLVFFLKKSFLLVFLSCRVPKPQTYIQSKCKANWLIHILFLFGNYTFSFWSHVFV